MFAQRERVRHSQFRRLLLPAFLCFAGAVSIAAGGTYTLQDKMQDANSLQCDYEAGTTSNFGITVTSNLDVDANPNLIALGVNTQTIQFIIGPVNAQVTGLSSASATEAVAKLLAAE